MAQNLVIIGAGMASGRLIENLLEQDPQAYKITLFNAEPRGNYNRLMLSPVLSGEKNYEEIITHSDAWYEDRGITTYFGEPVLEIDQAAKFIRSASNCAPYDKLVIATGSAPVMIPFPGINLEGVLPYRDLDNVNLMLDVAQKPQSKAVVIGGGVLGLEAAAGLNARGMDVTVIHISDHLMERQLDSTAAGLLQKSLEARGITVHTQGATKEIVGAERVEAVKLEDGTIYPADIVVMAVGIRPETRLAKEAGIATARGIIVDDALRTEASDIYALGECVEHSGQLFGLVAPLYEQAKVLANDLLGHRAVFTPIELSTKLKVTGCDLFSAGDFARGADRDEIVYFDPISGIYKRLNVQDNKLIGVVMYGDTVDGAWFLQKIKSGEDISPIRETLIFGPNFTLDAPPDPLVAVVALPLDCTINSYDGPYFGKYVSNQLGGDQIAYGKYVNPKFGKCSDMAGAVINE
ncbi:hypothetical protein GCM10007939_02640 [Amylibacter marinus]|uniref:Nitrite reductase (NADH) large subunit n=1 Tax=Amylibacter marinus TaxID=1475483 RepID=A0ABQ5VS18_9RHOB|nr:hypothetical protein GCM10007939_02640 [Amylibacter marinus]